jgi:hypothetical protein
MTEMRNARNILVGKCERKIPVWRPRRRWEYNIRMDLGEVWWGVWTGRIWLRLGTSGGCCEHGNELPAYIKSGEFVN